MHAAMSNFQIQGDTLCLHGTLDRAAVVALWPQLTPLPVALRHVNVQAVTGIDSAGLALLAELAAQLRKRGTVTIIGMPPGLAELSAAYRLTPTLEFKA